MKSIANTISLLILSSCLLLTGCSQTDSTVGSELTGGLTDPQEIIIDPTASAIFQSLATTGSSPYLYVGHIQDYEARSLLKFNPVNVLPDSFAVDSISFKLFSDTTYQNDGDPVDIEVSFVNFGQEWAEIGVTWDTLDSLELDDPILSFTISQTDDSVSFTIPDPFESEADRVFADSLIHAWDAAGGIDKTLHYNNGLYLQASSGSESLIRLCSAEYETLVRRPVLELYLTVYDTSDTTGAYPLQDTVSFQAGGDAFVATDYVGITDSTRLYLGNAIAHRTILFYDLEGILPSYGIAVHRAEILLHADTSSQFNIDKVNGCFYFSMEDTTWMLDPVDAPIAFGNVPVLSLYDEETATMTVKLNDLAYEWIRYPGTNQGVMIRSFDEYLDLSRTVFYGINAPDSLKPKLRIVYLEGE